MSSNISPDEVIQALKNAMTNSPPTEKLNEGYYWFGQHPFPITYHLFDGKRALVVPDEWMAGITEQLLQNEKFNVAFHALVIGPDYGPGWTCITFENK